MFIAMLTILVVGSCIGLFGTAGSLIDAAYGRFDLILRATLAMIAINAVCGLARSVAFGAAGAVAGYALALSVNGLLQHRTFARHLGEPPFASLASSVMLLSAITAGGLGMAAIAGLAIPAFQPALMASAALLTLTVAWPMFRIANEVIRP
jgi:hypothetical protein